MNARMMAVAGLAAILLAAGGAMADVFNMGPGLTSLEFVTVGDPGNAADTRYGTYGEVDYTYRIGKFEVTAGQYCEFLNAVASTGDPYGLWNPDMIYSYGCKIWRSGFYPPYHYGVASDLANRPVNWVSWASTVRFANWLTNGQPTGSEDLTTTEDGSYYLTMTDAHLISVTREPDAKYVLSSEDEWYKAAYYKAGGTNAGYWDYPTRSDDPPTASIPPGGINSANFNSVVGGTTDVGTYVASVSSCGTFDQGGNIWEWNEEIVYSTSHDPWRCARGGGFSNVGIGVRNLSGYVRIDGDPTGANCNIGFRVAEVPEPATLSLLALGGLAVLRRRSGRVLRRRG